MGNVELAVRRRYSSVMKAIMDDDPVSLAKFVRNPSEKTSALKNKPVTEKLLFDVVKKRNLLHLAVLYGATRCISMLVESPYRWDPDRPDAFGWTAMQLAEAFNNPQLMYPLACVSHELRHLEPLLLNKENQLITTRLYWPQDMMVYAFLTSQEPTIRAQTLEHVPARTPWRLSHEQPKLSGSALALIFELLLSESVPLTQEEWGHCLDEPLVQWPIRKAPLTNWSGHETSCTDYPNCLSIVWLRTHQRCNSEWESYRETSEIWKLHRFGWLDSQGSKPPSLQEQCRICLRRHLLNYTQPVLVDTQAHIYPNYAKLLSQLNLPIKLLNFLLYRELWPVMNADNGAPAEPVGKRTCFYKWTEKFGVGLRIGHGFIPIFKEP